MKNGNNILQKHKRRTKNFQQFWNRENARFFSVISASIHTHTHTYIYSSARIHRRQEILAWFQSRQPRHGGIIHTCIIIFQQRARAHRDEIMSLVYRCVFSGIPGGGQKRGISPGWRRLGDLTLAHCRCAIYICRRIIACMLLIDCIDTCERNFDFFLSSGTHRCIIQAWTRAWSVDRCRGQKSFFFICI